MGQNNCYHFFILFYFTDHVSDADFAHSLAVWYATYSKLRRRDIPVHVLQYEKLVNDFEDELLKLVRFLNFPISEDAIQCVIAANAKMKLFQRQKSRSEYSPYTSEQEKAIKRKIDALNDVWEAHGVSYHEWTWSSSV